MTVVSDIAPRQDLAALAKDFDRLFRARQSYRANPVGEGWDSAGGWVWKPAHEEWNACCVLRWSLTGDPRQAEDSEPTSDGPCAHMRTRKHVAALALLEPTFFRGIMDDIQAATTNRQQAFLEALDDQFDCHLKGIMPPGLANIARRFGLAEWEVEGLATEFANGRPSLLPVPEPRPADVTRTYRYLVDFDRRLRAWREKDAARAAVLAGSAPDPEVEAAAVRQREAMADAEANGDLDLLAEVA